MLLQIIFALTIETYLYNKFTTENVLLAKYWGFIFIIHVLILISSIPLIIILSYGKLRSIYDTKLQTYSRLFTSNICQSGSLEDHAAVLQAATRRKLSKR
jgi:hypothetical protein